MAKLIDDSLGGMTDNTKFKVIQSKGVAPSSQDVAEKCAKRLLGREYDSIAELARDVGGISVPDLRIIGSAGNGYSLSYFRLPSDEDKQVYRSVGLGFEF